MEFMPMKASVSPVNGRRGINNYSKPITLGKSRKIQQQVVRSQDFNIQTVKSVKLIDRLYFHQ